MTEHSVNTTKNKHFVLGGGRRRRRFLFAQAQVSSLHHRIGEWNLGCFL